MADYEYEDILYEVEGKVAYVTLNRPNQLNALSNRLRGEMVHAMKVAEMDNDVNVIVLRSAGRAFSAGYDLAGGTAPMDSPYTSRLTGRPDSGSTTLNVCNSRSRPVPVRSDSRCSTSGGWISRKPCARK